MREITEDSVLEAMYAFLKMKMEQEQEASNHSNTQENTATLKMEASQETNNTQ